MWDPHGSHADSAATPIINRHHSPSGGKVQDAAAFAKIEQLGFPSSAALRISGGGKIGDVLIEEELVVQDVVVGVGLSGDGGHGGGGGGGGGGAAWPRRRRRLRRRRRRRGGGTALGGSRSHPRPPRLRIRRRRHCWIRRRRLPHHWIRHGRCLSALSSSSEQARWAEEQSTTRASERGEAVPHAVRSSQLGQIFPNGLVPDLRGIFLPRDQPIPLTPKPNTSKSGFVLSHPIPFHQPNTTLKNKTKHFAPQLFTSDKLPKHNFGHICSSLLMLGMEELEAEVVSAASLGGGGWIGMATGQVRHG
uniref:Uncharacterized protein n=1 Tax=Oryza glumipatula TaxID=40148 RepID=A0A0E0AB91_9ORYZ